MDRGSLTQGISSIEGRGGSWGTHEFHDLTRRTKLPPLERTCRN